MKTQNPPKKLKLIKTTIAHLNDEQMNLACGGNTTITTQTNLITCTEPETANGISNICVADTLIA
jgi:hypothetical protein